MNTYLLYTKGSDHERPVAAFATTLERNAINVTLVDADSVRGIGLTEDYDITSRPAVVIVAPDGTAVERWLGQLPPLDEVSYRARG